MVLTASSPQRLTQASDARMSNPLAAKLAALPEFAKTVYVLAANLQNMDRMTAAKEIGIAFGDLAKNLPAGALIEAAGKVFDIVNNYQGVCEKELTASLLKIRKEVNSSGAALEPGVLSSMFNRNPVTPEEKVLSAAQTLCKLLENRGNMTEPEFDKELRKQFKPGCAGISTEALAETARIAGVLIDNRKNVDRTTFWKELPAIFGQALKY